MLRTNIISSQSYVTYLICIYQRSSWAVQPRFMCSCNNTRPVTCHGENKTRWQRQRVFMLWDTAKQTTHLQTDEKKQSYRMEISSGLKMRQKYQLRKKKNQKYTLIHFFFQPSNVIYLWIKIYIWFQTSFFLYNFETNSQLFLSNHFQDECVEKKKQHSKM